MTRRRASARRVKKHLNYTVEEAAEVTGLHPHTIRRWIKTKALLALTEKRPHLILGRDLHAFLISPKPGSARLKPGECYCVKCRLPRRPALDMADYITGCGQTGFLRGLCPECQTLMHSPVSLAKLPEISAGLDVTRMDAQPHLGERVCPSTNVDSGE
jgi:excisionase family DNA binding protein